MAEYEQLDDQWAGGFEWNGTVLTRKLFQPARSRILETIARWRREGAVARDGDSGKNESEWRGRWCLSIPLEDWEALRRHPRWCELHSRDKATAQAAWRKFLIHPDSAPFRVREKAS